MEDFELDEHALYGAAGEGSSPRHLASGDDAGSDDDADTEVRLGALTPQLSASSVDGGFSPIPENEEVPGSLPMMPGLPPLHPSAAIAMSQRIDSSSMSEPIAGIKMGSSAPISIPGFRMRDLQEKDEEMEVFKPVAATFVPPHLMGSVDTASFGFGWDGDSPAASLKREKLRTRNAILHCTGFLSDKEKEAARLSTLGGNVNSNQPFTSSSPIVSGGLKAALGGR